MTRTNSAISVAAVIVLVAALGLLLGLHLVGRFEVNGNIAIATIAVGLIASITTVLLHLNRLQQQMAADNHARTTAEASARASERDLRITLQSIGDAVISIDRDGRVRRLSEVAEHLTGWTQAEAIGRPADEILSYVDTRSGAPLASSSAEVLRTGSALVRTAELGLIRRDGTRRQIAENAAPIRDESGVVHGVVLVLQDTTVRSALEARLRDVQRMESIGRLAGGVAHEFNNLLQIVIGNTSLLRSGPVDPAGRDEARDALDRIDDAVQRAARLTTQMLAVGRRQALVLRSTDVGELVGRTLDTVRRLLPEGIQLAYHRPPIRATAHVDPEQIEQVMMNLCLHARDSMADGGRIEVALEVVEIGNVKSDAEPTPRMGQYVRVRIADNGAGLSHESKARIFEPYFSTSGSILDAGLELAVVHGVVQQHGGFVDVESTLGRGTTFTVFLPVRSEAETAPRVQTQAQAPPTTAATDRRRTPRILVAEDDRGVRALVERILQGHGFEPLVACDGLEAVKLLETIGGDLQLALLDVVMPNMGGLEVARRLRAAMPALPIVLCTGYADGIFEDIDLARPWTLLHKPYEVGHLIDTINHCLARSGISQQGA